MKITIYSSDFENCRRYIFKISSELLYSQENQSILIVGNKEDEMYFQLKNSFLQKSTILPYVESNTEYADMSPVVCSYEINNINKANTIVLFNYIISDLNSIVNIKCVYIYFTSQKLYLLQKQIISEFQNNSSIDLVVDDQNNKHHTYNKEDNIYKSTDQMKGTFQYKKNIEIDKNKKRTICIIKPFMIKNRMENIIISYLYNNGFYLNGMYRKKYDLSIWQQIYTSNKDTCEYLSNNYVVVLTLSLSDKVRSEAYSYLLQIVGDENIEKCSEGNLRYLFRNDEDDVVYTCKSYDEYEFIKSILFTSKITNNYKK